MQREQIENPFELQPSDDPIERVREFARDLAWGAVNKLWSAKIILDAGGNWTQFPFELRSTSVPAQNPFREKWSRDKRPSFQLLISFEYLHLEDTYKAPSETEYIYFLTPKAFSLLSQPIKQPSVFISYKHDESSSFGLLIEARLKLVDRNIGVFIDKLFELSDPGTRSLRKRFGRVAILFAYLPQNHWVLNMCAMKYFGHWMKPKKATK